MADPDSTDIVAADWALLGLRCRELRARYGWNARVSLVQLPQNMPGSFDREVAMARGYYAFPPTGLQYLYESLRPAGLEVRIVDLNLEMIERAREDASFRPADWAGLLEEHLEEFGPGLVGVSCMFDANIDPLTTVLELLRRRDRQVVVAGGVIPTYEWRRLLGQGLCHFVVQGEGENKLAALADSLAGKPERAAVPAGICFASEGRLCRTEGPSAPADMATDLVESYQALPLERYYRHGGLNPFSRMAGTPFAAVQASRGCRARCRFCSVPDFMGPGVRARPVESVLAEMEYLVTRRGIRHFEWLDDDLLCSRRDVESLFERIIAAGWGITWSASNGLVARSLDTKMLALMRESGCIGFRVGVETGNAGRLKRIGKPGTLETFRTMSANLAGFPELFVCANIMLGFPGETFAEMMDSYRFARELTLDWTGFTTCQPIRGADLFESFGRHFEEQMSSPGVHPANYIPARESMTGRLPVAAGTRRDLDVFSLPPDSVPDAAQVKEIWFTFNMVGNFLNNVNLRPGGRPEKFIGWVAGAQAAYPRNANLCLFLALACVIAGRGEKAREYRELAVRHAADPYWQGRLRSFGLSDIMDCFPRNAPEAYEAIERCRQGAARHEPPAAAGKPQVRP